RASAASACVAPRAGCRHPSEVPSTAAARDSILAVSRGPQPSILGDGAAPQSQERSTRARTLWAQEPDDILDLPHDRFGNGPGAGRTVAEDRIDLGGIAHQAPHLVADLADRGYGEIGQHLLEEGKFSAGEFGEHVLERLVGERGINPQKVAGLRPL